MRAQMAFRSAAGRFADSTAVLGVTLSAGIAVVIDSVTPQGYRARADYRRDADVGYCALWVGDSGLAVGPLPDGVLRCFFATPSWRVGSGKARWRE